MHIICLVTLEFLHSLDCGVGVSVDVVDGVEVKGGWVAHGGGAIATAADPGQVGERGAVLGFGVRKVDELK